MKKFTIALLLCCIFGFGSAQQFQEIKTIAKDILLLEEQGVVFEEVDMFNASREAVKDRPDLQQALNEGTILQIDKSEIKNLLTSGTTEIVFHLPSLNRASLDLQLTKVDPWAEGFSVITDISNDQPVNIIEGLHYRGIVKGDPFSTAAISIYENQIMGMIVTEDGNFVIGIIEGQNPNAEHIFYMDNELKQSLDFSCMTPDDGRVYKDSELQFKGDPRGAGDCVNIYIEVDKDIYQNKGSVQNAVDYVTGLFNQSAVIYNNENINTAISEVFVWTSGKPYKGNNASNLLSQFQSKRPSFNGDLAQLVNLGNNGGIAAGFTGICNSNSALSMCYSGIDASFNNVPTYSWSVFVFTHELGHLYGSRHTHACVWNGNATAIDGCAGSTEGSCALLGNPSIGGTLMSYCHLTSVGINFSEGFGTQPGNVIRNSVASATCLVSCGTSCNNNNIQDGDETGIDCGGSTCPPCASCTNNIQDGDETGVDCGGSICPPCVSCSNGIQDGDETGIDCGGSFCSPCYTCNNNIMDGDETGIDCGGATCPPCQTSCGTPGGLVATGIKPKRATLNWNSVSGSILYVVLLRPQGSSTWTSGSTQGTSITATSLGNGTTYEWQVRATCGGGDGNFSPLCFFTAGNKNSGACGSATSLVEADEFRVYPNPANQKLQINLPEDDLTYQIQIVDIYGRTMLTKNESVARSQMNLAGITDGVYIIRILEGDKLRKVEKVIIRH